MAHITVLSEYKIKDDKRDQFFELLSNLMEHLEMLGAEQISIFEGTDQPGLFVEEFILRDMDEYMEMKEEREKEQLDFWREFHECIEGGKSKVNIWAFSKVML
jgi:hypothetical protein